MKIYNMLVILLLINFSTNVIAQQNEITHKSNCTNDASYGSGLEIIIKSTEISNSGTGFVTLPIKVNSLVRGINITEVKITSQKPNDADLLISNVLPFGFSLDSGQLFTLNLNLIFKPNINPVYYKGFYLTIIDTINNRETKEPFFVYFTSYNTIEVWNYKDFTTLKRSWLEKPDSSISTLPRKYVSRDSIPESDIPDSLFYAQNDSTEINLDVRYVFIEGLGYAIPMLNDTSLIDWEELSDEDISYEPDEEGLKGDVNHYKNIFRKKRNFKGLLENVRIFAWHKVDNSSRYVKLPVPFIRVEIKQDGDIFNHTIKTVYTDAEGYLVEGGSRRVFFSENARKKKISVFLKMYMDAGDTKVKRNDLSFIEDEVTYKIEVSDYNNYQRLNYGDIELGEFHGSKQLTWIKLARLATNKELAVLGTRILNDTRITLKSSSGAVTTWSSTFGYRKITFGKDRMDEERTAFHEFGHFVHNDLQGGNYPFGSGGDHGRFWNNTNIQQALSEGWANGYAFIMDEILYNLDGESGYDSRNYYEHDQIFVGSGSYDQVTDANIGEQFFGVTLLDLWDGNTNYLKFGYPTNTVPNLYDIYGDEGNDNVEIPLYKLLEIFLEHGGSNSVAIQSIPEYLMHLFNADCSYDSELAELLNYNGYDNFGSDAIDLLYKTINYDYYRYENKTFVRDGSDVAIIRRNNLSNINSPDLSWNVAVPTSISQDLFLYYQFHFNKFSYVSDNLSVSNGGVLSFNKNTRSLLVSGKLKNIQFLGSFLTVTPPAIGSTYNFYVCGNTDVVIGQNGTMELGDRTAGNTAHVTIESGSTLRLRAGSKLSVFGKSTLTVNPGARLIVEPGAQIELVNDNSLIDFKGTLVLIQDVEFTFTGSGFVKFSSPSKAGDNIIFGNGSSINLVGSGQSDKVLEITQETVFIPNFNSFRVENGSIELASNCRLSVGGALTLNNARITSNTGLKNNHRGLYVYGNPQTSINNSLFENGYSGIFAELMFGGAPLTVSNSTFRNNYIGLYHFSKSANVNTCKFENNEFGLLGNALDFAEQIRNTQFINNKNAVRTLGEITSGTNVNNSQFIGNIEQGIITTGGQITSVKCTEFNRNNLAISSSLGNQLNLSTSFNAGNNSFISNTGAVRFEQSGLPMLLFGQNDFGDTRAIQLSGKISRSITSINATRNKWSQGLANRPIDGVNYSLVNINNAKLTLSDIFPAIAKGDCNVLPESPCKISVFNTGEGDPNVSLGCDVAGLAKCLTCDIIRLPDLPAIQLNAAVNLALVNLQNAKNSADKIKAIEMLQNILRAPLSSPDVADFDVLKLAYDAMMSGIGGIVKANASLTLDNSIAASVNAAIATLDYVAANIEGRPIVPPVNLTVSIAELYRMLQDRASSLSILNNPIKQVNYTVEEEEYRKAWICALEHEVYMLSDSTSRLFPQDILLCGLDINNIYANPSAPVQSELVLDINDLVAPSTITVSPNPVSGNELQITISNAKNENQMVVITDVNGSIVKKVSNNFVNSETLNIDITGLSRGVYFIRANSNNTVQTIRFVKL